MSKASPSATRKPALDAAPVFAALGDETRLGLVARLSEGDRVSITRLTEGTDVTRQAVTRHLEVLEDAGLVRGTRRGGSASGSWSRSASSLRGAASTRYRGGGTTSWRR